MPCLLDEIEFQYQPLHEGLLYGCYSVSVLGNFNTSPSTRGFAVLFLHQSYHIFQYQPLHEGLPKLGSTAMGAVTISIPAPPRGASATRSHAHAAHDFNTSPSTRGFSESMRHPQSAPFQYQPLHEGLPSLPVKNSGLLDFNTSPSTRGFPLSCMYRSVLRDFNTSPSTRGFITCRPHATGIRFQYQPLHEGLRVRVCYRVHDVISIPAPPRGASQ